MRRLLATVWEQVLVFTVACCAASSALMAPATWIATGSPDLGSGLPMSILIPALLARRHAYPTSLLLLDFDRFKDINDRCGHAGRDRCRIEAVEAEFGS
jgi:hypothetical protein